MLDHRFYGRQSSFETRLAQRLTPPITLWEQLRLGRAHSIQSFNAYGALT